MQRSGKHISCAFFLISSPHPFSSYLILSTSLRDGECWLINCHIAEYQRCGRQQQHKPQRLRKLLLHGREILKLEQRILQRNCELIPTRIYFNEKNLVKVEIGVGTKKNTMDKRDDMIKRDGEREIRRTMKGGYD